MSVRSVLITAANSGLGLPTTLSLLRRNVHVTATTRSPQATTHLYAAVPFHLHPHLTVVHLDLAQEQLPLEVLQALKTVDGVINNAGTEADLPRTRSGADGSVLALDWAEFQAAAHINAYGALKIMKACVPYMKERQFGRIVNVSSARASLGTVIGEVGAPCYDISKTLLNAFTAHLGHELRHTNVLVNALCPGWCATPMGGPEAPDTPQKGAQRIVRLLDLPSNGPNGQFFMNDQVVPF